MTPASELERIRSFGRWVSWIRLLAVPLALAEVGFTDSFPPGYRSWAWVLCGALAAWAGAHFVVTRRDLGMRARDRLGVAALTFDTAIVFGFIFLFSFESGQPWWTLFFLPALEGALRFGMRAGIAIPLLTAPILFAAEVWRSDHFEPSNVRVEPVAVRIALALIIGATVGRLVEQLLAEKALAEARASEAERLRDELGRRVDILDAANRCARALGSSLELEDAFNAFIRELRGLVPFERVAIALADDGLMRVIAAAGRGAEEVLAPGSALPAGSLAEDVLRSGRAVYRTDMADNRHPEEAELVSLGLRCRLVAPLLSGGRSIGVLSLLREEPDSFTEGEIELVSLLGRLVATTVQNIRAYTAEHRTADELRRLSALRADFVSLVSHELRSPMAAVIGAAKTLEQRWPELSAPQRESFLTLIAEETGRLATLISDVLDTSRIEAGTFTYSFTNVDMAELVRESVAAASMGQDDVRVRAETQDGLPAVRGDRERLRQVLQNLIENGVKYSAAGDEVEVKAYSSNGRVCVDVRDRGPGIPREHQKLIFEKFGRVTAGGAVKQGTGLGLFISRSIVEAHGGSLEVHSAPDRGSVFTLSLPFEPA